MSLQSRLTPAPFDQLAQLRDRAARRPGGTIDLTKGSPCDPVPVAIQQALAAAANLPGYPEAAGSAELRSAAAGWLTRQLGVPTTGEVTVIPGSKPLLSHLALYLDVTSGDVVITPGVAYQSYRSAAELVRAEVLASDDISEWDRVADRVKLIFINTPNNPTGRVVPPEELRAKVAWARAHDAIIVSDECYISFDWTGRGRTVLHPEVVRDDFSNVLGVYSLSKRSNMASYRSGFVAGDQNLVSWIATLQRQLSQVTGPVQAASVVAWQDETHVEAQRERYLFRRDLLTDALTKTGFEVTPCEGGIFLWASRPGLDDLGTAAWLAERGLLVVPGRYYAAGDSHVRIALTVDNRQAEDAAQRLERGND